MYIGVRDCPYGICCPWVRGGWDLDALGKFFRRRRRRRRPRPLLFRQFLEKVVIFSHFHQKLTFCDIFVLKVVFSPKNFRRRHACPHFSAFILEKICICYQKIIIFSQKLTFLDKNWHFRLFLFKRQFLSHKFSPKACLPVV